MTPIQELEWRFKALEAEITELKEEQEKSKKIQSLLINTVTLLAGAENYRIQRKTAEKNGTK